MARRLNTRFLTTLLLMMAGAAIIIYILVKMVVHEYPDQYAKAGDDAMAHRNWSDAVADYAKAASLAPHNADLQVRLGHALGELAQVEPSAVRQQMAAYNQALEINPNYLPALRALSELYKNAAAQNTDADLYRNAIDFTRRASQLDPSDRDLASLADKLIVQEWSTGLETDPKEVDDAVKDLNELWKKNPESADLPYAIACAKVQQGASLARQNAAATTQDPAVTAMFAQATGVFDSVLSGPQGGSQDHNAAMHYYYARLLQILSVDDQSDPSVNKKDMDLAKAQMDRARALIKPGDPNYLEINEYAAEMALQRGDRDEAIHIYRSMPESPMVTLALADVLSRSPDTQAEAEQMVKSTLAGLNDDPTHIAAMGLRFRLMMTLVSAQVSRYLEMPPSPQRDQLHDEIKASLDKLDTIAGSETLLPLKVLEAKFLVRSGTAGEIEAIQNLSKLIDENAAASKDYAVQMLLAEAYEDMNQGARAVSILTNVVQTYRRDLQAHKFLVELLIREAPDQALPYLEELERISPNDPTTHRLRLQLLLTDPEKNKEDIKKYYGMLPEDTAAQMVDKARIALQMRDYDEAARLLKIACAKDPSQAENFSLLAKVLFNQGKKSEALAVVKQGLVGSPNDPQLEILGPEINGEDPKMIMGLEEEFAKQDPDRVEGEINLALMAANRGDTEGQENHLKAAEKLAPNSPRVQQALFDLYLRTNRFDEAATYIAPLAAADYDHAGGEFYRLALARGRGNNVLAEQIARKLTVDKPEFARTWLVLGDVLQNEEKYDQAIEQYEQALAKQSNLAEAYIGLAECFYKEQPPHPQDALQIIDEGLDKVPNDPELRQMKLTYDLNFGKPNDAFAELQDEIRSHPNDPRLYAALADLMERYAGTLRANGQHDDAITQANQAVQILNPALQRWPDEAALYIALAEAQLAADRSDDALKALQTWAGRDAWKMKPDPYLRLAEFYERLGSPDTAESNMRTAVAKSNYRVDLQLQFADMLARHKKYDDALGLLRATNADKPAVREKTVVVLLAAGRYDDAQAELKADLAGNPSDAEQLLTIMALSQFEHGDASEAVDNATKALQINPNDMTDLFCRGRARLQMEPPDPTGALQDFELVRQSNPNRIDIRLNVAQAYLMLNQLEDAAGELRAGLRAEPNNKAVRMKLVEIYMNDTRPELDEAVRLLEEVDSAPPFDKDPDIFETEAVIYSKMGQLQNAMVRSEKALSLTPNNPEIVRTNLQLLLDSKSDQDLLEHIAALSDKLRNSSWAYWYKALVEKRMNNPAALGDFKLSLAAAIQEDDGLEFDQIAKSLVEQFDADTAINTVLPLSNNYVNAKLTLAHLYQGKGDDADALQAIDQVMADFDKMRVKDQVNTLATASLLYQLAKPVPLVDKAYDAYLRWIKIQPDNLLALNNLACLLADNYSPPRAEEGLAYAKRAVDAMYRLGRTEPHFLDTQAWLLILNGQVEDGVAQLNKTMLDSPALFPEEHYHLGEGYFRMPNPDFAAADKEAKLGLDMINKQPANVQDATLKAKLQELANRSEEMMKSRQQAQVP
jgi:tetratricopeptide (TPR) repeat protein